MKWEANLRGINLDKEIKNRDQEQGYMFKDPSKYEKMTEKEKQAETSKMMGDHKQMFNMPGGS